MMTMILSLALRLLFLFRFDRLVRAKESLANRISALEDTAARDASKALNSLRDKDQELKDHSTERQRLHDEVKKSILKKVFHYSLVYCDATNTKLSRQDRCLRGLALSSSLQSRADRSHKGNCVTMFYKRGLKTRFQYFSIESLALCHAEYFEQKQEIYTRKEANNTFEQVESLRCEIEDCQRREDDAYNQRDSALDAREASMAKSEEAQQSITELKAALRRESRLREKGETELAM